MADHEISADTATINRSDAPPAAYVLTLQDGTEAGRAYFLDAGDERVFYHTVVPEEFGGHGLGTLLVKRGLAESIAGHKTVVPVCSLFAHYLDKNREQFTIQGGSFREPSEADLATVKSLIAES